MDAISAEEISGSTDQRCPNCHCSMSAEWPDLAQFREVWGFYHKKGLRCSLCRMIAAVLRDAREKQYMTEPKQFRPSVEVLRRDDRYLIILTESTLLSRSKEHVVVYREGKQIRPSKIGVLIATS